MCKAKLIRVLTLRPSHCKDTNIRITSRENPRSIQNRLSASRRPSKFGQFQTLVSPSMILASCRWESLVAMWGTLPHDHRRPHQSHITHSEPYKLEWKLFLDWTRYFMKYQSRERNFTKRHSISRQVNLKYHKCRVGPCGSTCTEFKQFANMYNMDCCNLWKWL